MEVFELQKNLGKVVRGMNKPIILFIMVIFLFNFFIINLEPLTFTLHADALRYGTDVNVSVVDVSFHGETSYDQAGWGWAVSGITGSGDVNGDGYDDILIGALDNDRNGNRAGAAFLFFGQAGNWSIDMDASNADAIFVGEYPLDSAGISVCIAGDINGDDYDDILISSISNDEGGKDAGQVYLIFGKSSGWLMNTNLSTADASFIGEAINDSVGQNIDGAGDVNGDGYDDFLIGSESNSEGGSFAGQVYLIFGKASGWSMNTSLSNVNASFLGVSNDSMVGDDIAGVGDVNNDGFDDILIGAGEWISPSRFEHRTYLFYGKNTGWSMDTKITDANVTFFEETWNNAWELSIAGAGDVNGDSIDDIIIGYPGNHDAGLRAGKSYLIFGQTSKWSGRIGLSSADASFVGENSWYDSGWKVEGGGDVNGDGYDDILIMAFGEIADIPSHFRNNEVYLILGKASGWSKDRSLSSADASFVSESSGDYFGCVIVIAGDVNCDGFDDILITAFRNNEGGSYAGQIYLIFPTLSLGPIVVNSVKVYSDAIFTKEIDIAEIGDTVYVELIGTDENTTHVDNAAVNISSTSSSLEGFWLYLLETGFNTGKYRGSFKISDRTHPHLKLINATIGENIMISSVKDKTKNTTILVSTPIQLRPFKDRTYVIEDEEYFMHYWNFGYNAISTWTNDTNASWLTWDKANHDFYGTPNNGDVGTFWVRLNITDGLGNYDEHYFDITVNNMPPNITNEDVIMAMEDELYYVDYNSSDDGQGTVIWYLETNATWLEIESTTGELSGTPTNEDRGRYWVNISVDDGNGGMDWSNFTQIVFDTNDAPTILTENVTTAYEDKLYSVIYKAIDIDGDQTFEWYLDTNASWLNMKKDSGELYGTPTNDDVGISFVNISVSDSRSGSDSQNFTLEVINVNDPPEWVTVPTDTEVYERGLFIFDVNASDIDSGDVLSYYINSRPETNITIDSNTGLIEWWSTIENLDAPFYALEVILTVTDGNVTIWNTFKLTVIPNSHPISMLLSPVNDSIVSTKGTELKWMGYDSENEYLTYDLYFGKDKTSVLAFSESTKLLSDTNVTSYLTEGLTTGSIYYWTVIPKDWLNYGECVDGIFSFKINSPPRIRPISSQRATVGIEFRFEVEASDSNPGDIQNFEYSLDFAPDGMTINLSTGVIIWTPIKAQVGIYTIELQVSDGKDVANTTFEIEVTEKLVETTSFTWTYVVTAVFIILIIIIINIGIISTEVGKYKFLSVIFVPMYNKLHPDNIFNNFLRGQIYGYINAKPGENYNAIKKALKLNNGTLAHHARVLEKEGYVYSKRDGLYTRFYPKDMKVPEPVTLKLNKIQKNMVEIIRTQPGITQHEIIPLLNKNQTFLSYNLTKLIRNNIIKLKHNGRENRYYINYELPEIPQPQIHAELDLKE